MSCSPSGVPGRKTMSSCVACVPPAAVCLLQGCCLFLFPSRANTINKSAAWVSPCRSLAGPPGAGLRVRVGVGERRAERWPLLGWRLRQQHLHHLSQQRQRRRPAGVPGELLVHPHDSPQRLGHTGGGEWRLRAKGSCERLHHQKLHCRFIFPLFVKSFALNFDFTLFFD